MKYIIEIPPSVTMLIENMTDDFKASEVFHYIPDYLSSTVDSIFDAAVELATEQVINGSKSWDSYEELACDLCEEAETMLTAFADSIGRIRVNKLISTFVDFIAESQTEYSRFPLAVCSQYESMATRTDSRNTRKVNILLSIAYALAYEISSRFRDAYLLEIVKDSLPTDIPVGDGYTIRHKPQRRTVLLEVA